MGRHVDLSSMSVLDPTSSYSLYSRRVYRFRERKAGLAALLFLHGTEPLLLTTLLGNDLLP